VESTNNASLEFFGSLVNYLCMFREKFLTNMLGCSLKPTWYFLNNKNSKLKEKVRVLLKLLSK
jgi:hypothetical protein